MQSSSRNGAKVRVLAVHTTEGIMRAADLKAWKTWPGSSHASADETGVLMTPADGFVPYDRSAWTLRNGNPWSENIELCGFAKWKRPDWLARPKLLDACARWLAERSVARGIPLVKLSPKELAAGRSGVIGHVDYTVGYSDGTHWDPGPDFPYDVVLAAAKAYAAGKSPAPLPTPMPVSEEDDDMRLIAIPSKAVYKVTAFDVSLEPGIYRMGSIAKGWDLEVTQVSLEEFLDIKADVDDRRARLLGDIAKAAGGDIDEVALGKSVVNGLLPQLIAALSAETGATREDVEEVVRGVFADAAS